jgi:hypothetical protein
MIGCYIRLSPQVRYKKCNIRFFEDYVLKNVVLFRQGQHIGRKENFSGVRSPVRDVIWEGKHFVPDGTRGEGMVFFYRYNVPCGTKKNEYFFEY